MAQYDDVKTSAVAVVGLVSAILTVALILLLVIVYYRIAARQEYQKDVSQPYLEVENLLAEQQAKLLEYRWVDREKQVVTIPIDRAMELVVRELSSEATNERREDETQHVAPQGNRGGHEGVSSDALE